VRQGRFTGDRTLDFPALYLEVAAGRRVILHAMHSVTDTFVYAVWENGALVRSLALTPADGIVENIRARCRSKRPTGQAAPRCGHFSASS
jgi:hypothetical protein